MRPRFRQRWLSRVISPLLLALSSAVVAQDQSAAPSDEADLRSRLTEREDENRVEQPWTTLLFGHPLSATVQVELATEWTHQFVEDDPPDGETRTLLEDEVEGELFYTRGPQFSVLLQARIAWEDDLRSDTRRGVSDAYVERGETWLHSERIFGTPLTFEIGRLDFEDERRWWWDEDLDAVRIGVEGDSFDWALAYARELGPSRSDRGFIEPEQEAVTRLIAEASWDWAENHTIDFFALRHDDHSRTHQPEEVFERDRDDDSDARLRWFGLRATGAWSSASAGLIGYWLDAARVYGSEQVLELAPLSDEPPPEAQARRWQSSDQPSPDLPLVVVERLERDVHGWGVDAGVTWLTPLESGARFTAGYAIGSGDRDPDDANDRGFRQTGLHANSPGFGGVQSFRGYGVLLDPELSNLSVVTLGAGVSLREFSSLDFLYHRYRLVELAEELRSARIVAPLTGENGDVGQAFDLVLAIEESQHWQLELSASAFRAGDAFATQPGDWTFGAFAALRLAF
jgi:alginate production protein